MTTQTIEQMLMKVARATLNDMEQGCAHPYWDELEKRIGPVNTERFIGKVRTNMRNKKKGIDYDIAHTLAHLRKTE